MPFTTPGNYSDYAWTTVGTWKNPSRADAVTDNKTLVNDRPTEAGYLPWINVIQLDSGARGRYIRVKATAPLANVANEGTWTSWPRISMLEVYTETLTE